jgi:hypothetical protein
MLIEARIRAERPCRGAGVDVLQRRTGGARGQRRCRGKKKGLRVGLLGQLGPVSYFLGFFPNPFLFLFLVFQTQIYLNSTNLNSNPYALNKIKFMHQHECMNMLNLK